MGMQDLRRNYAEGQLDISDLASEPIEQFSRWFAQAQAAESADWFECNAMTLATADRKGAVSARIVLLKKVSPEGFAFFTNYDSAKAAQLAANPQASLVFYWPHLERQIRIEGLVAKTDSATSDEYFHERPRGSQVGAVASPQSREISSRDELEASVQQLTAKLGDGPIERPEYWGGFVLSPTSVEFWQGRPSRLHDRFLYTPQGEGGWTIKRLAP